MVYQCVCVYHLSFAHFLRLIVIQQKKIVIFRDWIEPNDRTTAQLWVT